MNSVVFYVLASTTLVSLVSLVGIATLALNRNFLNKSLFVLIALASGALLGDVFFHLLPETIEHNGFTALTSLLILTGFLSFFLLEKLFIWHHHHLLETPEDHKKKDHSHPCEIGFINLLGDGIHNFADGMLIAASFLVDPIVGVGTTVAVLLHEIPQEIGDFGVLIHSGFTVKKALFFNFLTALAAVAGALLVLSFGAQAQSVSEFLIPFTIGSFLYIAAGDLIPELKKQGTIKHSLVQFVALLVGIAAMYGLLWVEAPHLETYHEEHTVGQHEESLAPGQVYVDSHGDDYHLILEHE